MMELITGGSASGKSEYAETRLTSAQASRKLYLATMVPGEAESQARIEKHRQARSDKEFETVERFTGLSQLVLTGSEHPDSRAILLECMSNLVANERYLVGGSEKEIQMRVINGVRDLQKQAHQIIIVTNEVFSDGMEYDTETRSYLRLLGEINEMLAVMADIVTEVVYGIPVTIKHKG